ncbi:MAG: rRNA pseudouridine synthase [Planctomycetes bacterium]|nr:rRNA pseudouridine synthase [Planctomycetota bacterium]
MDGTRRPRTRARAERDRPVVSAPHELERLLSKAGACSRVEARERIRAGRVRVDGRVVRDPARRFASSVRLELDGEPLRAAMRRYLALHKPRGYLTTRRDPQGRPTVYDLLEGLEEFVVPVGRLDLETSGLLLLTNDTLFSDRVTDPASHLSKTYRVEARPRLDELALQRLRAGPRLSDGPTRPARVEKLGDRGPVTRLLVSIDEGRNRQVRRMLEAVGSRVQKLARISIGPLELGELAPGKWRELEAGELRALRAAVAR